MPLTANGRTAGSAESGYEETSRKARAAGGVRVHQEPGTAPAAERNEIADLSRTSDSAGGNSARPAQTCERPHAAWSPTM
jgi:hypothetical protein